LCAAAKREADDYRMGLTSLGKAEVGGTGRREKDEILAPRGAEENGDRWGLQAL